MGKPNQAKSKIKMAPYPQEDNAVINDASLADAPEIADQVNSDSGLNIVEYKDSGSVEKAGNRVLEGFLIVLAIAAVVGVAFYLLTLLKKKDEPEQEGDAEKAEGEPEADKKEDGEETEAKTEAADKEESKPLAENAGEENKE